MTRLKPRITALKQETIDQMEPARSDKTSIAAVEEEEEEEEEEEDCQEYEGNVRKEDEEEEEEDMGHGVSESGVERKEEEFNRVVDVQDSDDNENVTLSHKTASSGRNRFGTRGRDPRWNVEEEEEGEEEEEESDAAPKQSPREVKEAKRREKMARERRHAKDFTFKSLKNFWNKVEEKGKAK